MKVSEALQDEGLQPYYQQKFRQIADKAGIADLDVEKDWKLIKRQLQGTFSLNGAALLGSVWGAYRQAPYWPVAVGINIALIGAGIALSLPTWVMNFNAIGLLYISFGNSLLLIKYLRARIRLSSMTLVHEHMQTNMWFGILAAIVAVASLGSVFFVDLKRQVDGQEHDIMRAMSPAERASEGMDGPFFENEMDASAIGDNAMYADPGAMDYDDETAGIDSYPEPTRSNFIRSCEVGMNARFQQSHGTSAPTGYASSMCGCLMNYMEGDLPVEDFVQYDLALMRGESGTHPDTEAKLGKYLGFCVRDLGN